MRVHENRQITDHFFGDTSKKMDHKINKMPLSEKDQLISLLDQFPKWVTSVRDHESGNRKGLRARFSKCGCKKDNVVVLFTKTRTVPSQLETWTKRWRLCLKGPIIFIICLWYISVTFILVYIYILLLFYLILSFILILFFFSWFFNNSW